MNESSEQIYVAVHCDHKKFIFGAINFLLNLMLKLMNYTVLPYKGVWISRLFNYLYGDYNCFFKDVLVWSLLIFEFVSMWLYSEWLKCNLDLAFSAISHINVYTFWYPLFNYIIYCLQFQSIYKCTDASLALQYFYEAIYTSINIFVLVMNGVRE